MDLLKQFDATAVLLWVVPGAFIALFRSFAIRGNFPPVGKDDVAALLLGSVVYYFVVRLCTTGIEPTGTLSAPVYSGWTWFAVLIVIPAAAGLLLGLLEASDAIGATFRKFGIPLPSPDATAWETLFRNLPTNTVLLVTLKDGTRIAGCWVGATSAASNDPKTMDIYIGQIGAINGQGQYVPQTPPRGLYLPAGEIRAIEVIRP